MRIAKTSDEKKEWLHHQKHQGAKAPFVDSDYQNKGEKWVTYKLNDAVDFHQKQRYEWFCAGFLLYYDDILRNGAVDHIMTFEWTEKAVTIFISPAPQFRQQVDGKLKYPNWKQRDPQLLVSSYGLMSDPPPPPPPPPPPMDM
jgi:hypothetical protein